MKNKKVGQLARVGALWTTGSRLGYYFLFIITGMFLARLLTPAEFGLMALVNLTTVLIKHFFEFGLSYAFIQEKEVSADDTSTFFYMQVGMSLIIWLGILLVSPFVAEYYQQPLLRWLLPVHGVEFILEALSRVPMTIMARELNYKLNSIIGLIGSVAGAVIAVTMAFMGFGVWSLVGNALATAGTVLLIVVFRYPWRPSLVFRVDSARRLLNFGKWMLVSSLVGYLTKNLDYILVSRLLGLSSLGFYERAFNLMRTPQKLITNSVNKVLFSAFSRIQEEPERIRQAFRKVVSSICLLSYPVLFGMLLMAKEFVLVIYGDQWVSIILPLRIMCLAGILVAIDPLLNSILTSSGFVKYATYRKITEVLILAIACTIGSYWGIAGFAWATVSVAVVVLVMMMQLLKGMSRISWKDYLQPQIPAMIACAFMSAAVLLLRFLWQQLLPYPVFAGLAVLSMAGAAVYIAVLLQLDYPELAGIKSEIRSALKNARRTFRSRKAGV